MFPVLFLLTALLDAPPQEPNIPPVIFSKPLAVQQPLFDVRILPPNEGRSPMVTRRSSPRSKVVCGTTIIMVDPEAAPKMPRLTPEGKDGVHYTMRKMPPPACGR